MKRNKKIIVALYISIFIPVAIFLGNFGVSGSTLEGGVFNFITRISEQTKFDEVSNSHLISVITLLPIQLALIAWLVFRTDIRNFDRSRERLMKNEPLFKLGKLVFIRQKIGVGICSLLLMALIATSMFYVGGDLYLCNGCETNNRLVYLVVNTLGVISLLTFAAVFGVWLRLVPLTRR